MKTAVILGAGFSKNSGIPVQSEIPELLVNHNEKNEFERAVSMALREFMKDIFGYDGGNSYPNLDDIFTCIDISTNSGHHLGMKYSPQELRGVRRFLVYRVFSILQERFKPVDEVVKLLKVLKEKSFGTSYVVLNWDNVLEKYISDFNTEAYIDYCNGGINWNGENVSSPENTFKILKPHGSSNWVYCDNCRNLYYDMADNITLIEKAGFMENDYKLLEGFLGKSKYEDILKYKNCKACRNNISSHIATFSYRKSFRANSFSNVWREAERVLSDSDRWVFIGYSLPEADYEFKHLLKIAELKLAHVKGDGLKVDVVLLNSDNTVNKYESFFGSRINRICNKGIVEYTDYLKTL